AEANVAPAGVFSRRDGDFLPEAVRFRREPNLDGNVTRARVLEAVTRIEPTDRHHPTRVDPPLTRQRPPAGGYLVGLCPPNRAVGAEHRLGRGVGRQSGCSRGSRRGPGGAAPGWKAAR